MLYLEVANLTADLWQTAALIDAMRQAVDVSDEMEQRWREAGNQISQVCQHYAESKRVRKKTSAR